MKFEKKVIVFTLLLFSLSFYSEGQSLFNKYKQFLTIPKGYVCYRTQDSVYIDGLITEKSWENAPETDSFVDISGYNFPKPRFNTKVKMLWDDNYLYVFAEMEEPDVWANIKTRDAVVFYDNDFEVFIDPVGDGHNYFEIETNALGCVFDLELEKPYRSPLNSFIQFQWNCPGLKIATHCNGKINDHDVEDKSWTVEMAIPRKSIASSFTNFLKANNYLRIDFSRVEWQFDVDKNGHYDRKKDSSGKYLKEDNWVWTPTGRIAMHMPERWGFVYLSPSVSGKSKEDFKYPDYHVFQRFLWMLFYAQSDHFEKYKCYYKDISDFKLDKQDWKMLPAGCRVLVESTSNTYEITLFTKNGDQWVIDESGRCFKRKKN